MFDANALLAIVAAFVIAGTVKGVIGLGLPTVSLGLLTVAIDLPTAMALLLVPSLVTNLWQASIGGSGRVLLTRLWPFLLLATTTVWLGVHALTRVDLRWLSVLLGVLLVTYSLVSLIGLKLRVPARHEPWFGVLAGSVNGVLTGMTGSFVVPGVIYLQSLGLPRDALIQAMGMLFTASTLALGFALHGSGLLVTGHAVVSVVALLPAVAGMLLGQRIRRNLSEQLFRRVFFVCLLTLGIYIAGSAFGGFHSGK